MDTPKKHSDQSQSAPDSMHKPLTVTKETLKDLEPETRDAQQVKGGIPPKLNP